MRISRLCVDGYRRFEKQEVFLEGHTTVFAGANNSGKTSLIDLLRVVLKTGKEFSADDFSAAQRLSWSSKIITAALDGEQEFRDFIKGEEVLAGAPSIEVKLEVEYDPKKDDIREFADFLMDLDLSKNSFYFLYRFTPKSDKLLPALEGLYTSIRDGILKEEWVPGTEINSSTATFHSLQAKLSATLINSCVVEIFFTDHTYTSHVAMERNRFLGLFNFRIVKAARPLDDTIDDNSGSLSRKLVEVTKDSAGWKAVLESLPGRVLAAIDATDIKSVTTAEALKSLNDVVSSISKTNGTSQSDLFLDFQVSEEDAIRLIGRAMQTRYSGSGVPLGEASQGLGYSNLILLHLETESFLRSATLPENALLVNLMVLEEPESHMHPQMQNAFIKHLFDRVAENNYFQAVITTHSSEIVRSSSIELLRVLKVIEGACKVIDLRKFHEQEVAKKSSEKQRLFNFLYSINFADILFADKVVMYEGDTERMYIQALIKERDDLAGLRTQYISYVQVGGAYAHIYVPLIVDTLGIQTAVITDIDYAKNSTTDSVEAVRKLTTTNATLNEFFAIKNGDESNAPDLDHLFKLKKLSGNIAMKEGSPLLAVAYQTESEGCARTLEEAIFAGLNAVNVWESKTRKEWKAYRKASSLKFTVPEAPDDLTIRKIVEATSDKKTDFMYSLLLQEDFGETVPPYILAALNWLDS